MRAIGLALVALALSASPAHAAVLEIRDNFCGCDGSSGDEDTRTLIVRAAPGEVNRMSVRQMPRGVLVEDSGAPLTGACRPSGSGGRFCAGAFSDSEIELGDGDDTLSVDGLGSAVSAGDGADSVLVTGSFHVFRGGAGADRLETGPEASVMVSYSDHAEGVTVRLNGLADDGAPGEGDQILGAISSIQGGAGNDRLEAGPGTASLAGEGGNDTLLGGPRDTVLQGDAGDDELLGADGDDTLLGGAGADVIDGGSGRDAAAFYDHDGPVRASIGDGADDGSPGEGDDIRADVEDIGGTFRDDVLIGSDGVNRLNGGSGRDQIFGLAGDDVLVGTAAGSVLEPGAGGDRVIASGRDRLRLDDGEPDSVTCHGHGPEVSFDELDSFHACAPSIWLRELHARRAGTLRLRLTCDPQSSVPCRGRVVVRSKRRQLAPAARVSALLPGQRRVLTVRLRLPLPRTCVSALVTSRRNDIPTVTERAFRLHCGLP